MHCPSCGYCTTCGRNGNPKQYQPWVNGGAISGGFVQTMPGRVVGGAFTDNATPVSNSVDGDLGKAAGLNVNN